VARKCDGAHEPDPTERAWDERAGTLCPEAESGICNRGGLPLASSPSNSCSQTRRPTPASSTGGLGARTGRFALAAADAAPSATVPYSSHSAGSPRPRGAAARGVAGPSVGARPNPPTGLAEPNRHSLCNTSPGPAAGRHAVCELPVEHTARPFGRSMRFPVRKVPVDDVSRDGAGRCSRSQRSPISSAGRGSGEPRYSSVSCPIHRRSGDRKRYGRSVGSGPSPRRGGAPSPGRAGGRSRRRAEQPWWGAGIVLPVQALHQQVGNRARAPSPWSYSSATGDPGRPSPRSSRPPDGEFLAVCLVRGRPASEAGEARFRGRMAVCLSRARPSLFALPIRTRYAQLSSLLAPPAAAVPR